jgi:hypothetical protein
MKLKPEILTHPNIPKPLHGMNPRTILGKEWWDKTRQEAYASTDYHCSSCGVHKSEAKKHKWLEAHEYWDINCMTGICEVKDIVPLCHYCHNFIHSGRLSMILGKSKSKEEVIEILEHGFKILKENNLKCFAYSKYLARKLGAKTYDVDYYMPEENEDLEWSDYALILEGKTYKSKFDNIEEWKEFYKNKENEVENKRR